MGRFITQLLNSSIVQVFLKRSYPLRVELRFLFLCSFVFLFFSVSGAAAQKPFEQYGLSSRFGPHLACSNQTDFIRKVRKNYQFLGWEESDWIPATIMFKITDPPDYIKAGLIAMTDDFEKTPRLWPIVRLDGDPHGDRITEDEIIQFRETLRAVGRLGSLSGKQIFFEFANEPNHKEEWKPAIEPSDYRVRLEDFVREVRVVRDIGGFRVMNAALDQRAGDSPMTMEAIKFWDEGNLESVVGSLDGYAFNNYHFEPTGRYSKEGWKEMRVSFGMTEDKPVFLVEYGLDPGAGSGERISFLQKEYQMDLGGVNPAVAEVTAVTPLFCFDDDPNDENSCPKKNTAIFGTEGELLFMEQDKAGSCGELLSCCGLPASIQTARCAKEVSECRARARLPAKLSGKVGFSGGGSTLGVRETICGKLPDWLRRKLAGILCEFADVSDHLAQFEDPEEIGAQIGAPDVPDLPEEPPPPPPGEGEGRGQEPVGLTSVGVQGFNPVDWIWRIIAPRTVDEKTGWLGQYGLGGVETGAAGVQALGGGGTEDEVLGEFERTRQKFTPYRLLKAFGTGVGIPEGRIPSDGAPPPGPGGQAKCSGGVCYYSQRDPAYANEKKMGNCTIRKAGCGPTTVAMIKASFVDSEQWNPISVIDTYYPDASCAGSSGYDAMRALRPEGFEIGETIFYDWDNPKAPSEVVKQMRESTEAGWDLFCSANMYWGEEQGWIGHLFWVTEVTPDDEIMVMDSYFGYGYDYPMPQSSIPDRFDPHYKYCIQFKP